MMCAKKVFLFVVGVITITLDEINKYMAEAAQSIDEQTQKINERVTKHEA
jgi:hypothetical protein